MAHIRACRTGFWHRALAHTSQNVCFETMDEKRNHNTKLMWRTVFFCWNFIVRAPYKPLWCSQTRAWIFATRIIRFCLRMRGYYVNRKWILLFLRENNMKKSIELTAMSLNSILINIFVSFAVKHSSLNIFWSLFQSCFVCCSNEWTHEKKNLEFFNAIREHYNEIRKYCPTRKNVKKATLDKINVERLYL